MIEKIVPVLACLVAVIGAFSDMRIAAVVLCVAFLVCCFAKLDFAKFRTAELRIVLVCAVGFPLLLLCANNIATGLLAFLLTLSVLLHAEVKLTLPVVAAALCAGVCGVLVPAVLVVAAVLIFCAGGVYVMFVKEYRINKSVEVRVK